ncbi:hypothetical protein FISHEDRAFT_69435 [Fistulina hepatica ATCC 64428]|uniref:RING-type domain-containing protein n=1 Tax=Fistulina hepatica ATCC 64428 TaxID=1128425 RepID=A0A0D7AQA1_9AGAR|nr:hypothetical protein FISHEDRAFT_69435 [Fistulina hepatica ATCC 64428]
MPERQISRKSHHSTTDSSIHSAQASTSISTDSKPSRRHAEVGKRSEGPGEQAKKAMTPAGTSRMLSTTSGNHVRRHTLSTSGPSEDRRRDRVKGKERAIHPNEVPSDTEHMRAEMEALRSVIAEQRRTIKKQKKLLDEHERTQLAQRDQDVELQALKVKSNNTDLLISSIESHLQCQVCMDILLKPFSLSPCGHVLCLACLQEWFRKAPANDDNDMDSDDPDYLLYRPKSCPCCRTVVNGRPAPAFIVKNIANALHLPREASDAGRPESPTSDSDPWKGLFPDSEHDSENSDAESMVSDLLDLPPRMGGLRIRYSDDSDEDEADVEDEDSDDGVPPDDDDSFDSDHGLWIEAEWEPPLREISPEAYPDASADELQMLRRGCSLQMIHTYNMTYSVDEGLLAQCFDLDRNYCLYLGWNVMAWENDELFMDESLNEIDSILDHDEGTWKWNVTVDDRGVVIARRRLLIEDS